MVEGRNGRHRNFVEQVAGGGKGVQRQDFDKEGVRRQAFDGLSLQAPGRPARQDVEVDVWIGQRV
jgi:hypothetical protein